MIGELRERDVMDVATPSRLRRHKRRKAALARVADLHGVTVAQLMLPSHARGAKVPRIAHARFHAMAVMRTRFGDSLPAIGRMFGGRDHTSVMYGIARWHELERMEGGA